jgi:hypothetical protein
MKMALSFFGWVWLREGMGAGVGEREGRKLTPPIVRISIRKLLVPGYTLLL